MSCSNKLDQSLHWKLRYDVEWSEAVKTKFFVESLGLVLGFVNMEDSPLLVLSTSLFVYDNLLSFLIF